MFFTEIFIYNRVKTIHIFHDVIKFKYFIQIANSFVILDTGDVFGGQISNNETENQPEVKSSDKIQSRIDGFVDVNLIAQELANTGSSQSENQLSYLMDTFIATECYEWVFLLALVLKRLALVNEVMRKLISSEFSKEMSDSLYRGIEALDIWSENEW